MSSHRNLVSLFFLAALIAVPAFAQQDWRSGIQWTEPKTVTPAAEIGAPPSDAIVLFDGKNAEAWSHDKWEIKDGVMTIKGGGDLRTKQKFGSMQLHLEFASPKPGRGQGQGRGNSGVFLMDRFEVQILDSYNNTTYFDGQCAGIYKQRPPYVNASREPGQWQSYDIFFTRPELKIIDGKIVDVLRPAYVTIVHNGVLVVNNFAIEGNTAYHIPPAYTAMEDKGAIRLQDHGNAVQFRNIWVREIPDANLKPPRGKEFYSDDNTIPKLRKEVETLKAELEKMKSETETKTKDEETKSEK